MKHTPPNPCCPTSEGSARQPTSAESPPVRADPESMCARCSESVRTIPESPAALCILREFLEECCGGQHKAARGNKETRNSFAPRQTGTSPRQDCCPQMAPAA